MKTPVDENGKFDYIQADMRPVPPGWYDLDHSKHMVPRGWYAMGGPVSKWSSEYIVYLFSLLTV